MGSFLSFIQIIFCSSRNYIFLMLQVIIQHLQEIHYFWLIANQCQHNNAKCILQTVYAYKADSESHRIHITTQFDADPHTFTARLVAQICDSIDFLISYSSAIFSISLALFTINGSSVTIIRFFPFCIGSILVIARTRILPRPVLYASSIPLVPRISAPVREVQVL